MTQLTTLFSSIRKALYALTFFFLFTSSSVSANLISPPLLQLLDLMEVEHNGTLSSIVDGTQKQWLRPVGKERWEINDLSPEKALQVIALVDQMGFFQEVKPTQTSYDYCLVCGATVRPLQARFNYMVQLWNEGIRFQEIVFLASQRPLDPAVESLDGCATESDAARSIWENSSIPQELRALPVTFIDVPMIVQGEGVRRATRIDTIQAWFAQLPDSITSGSCLFVTNQPYCLYENAIEKSCIPSSFIYETVGPAGKKEFQKASVLLDTIARWLYNEQKGGAHPNHDLPRSP